MRNAAEYQRERLLFLWPLLDTLKTLTPGRAQGEYLVGVLADPQTHWVFPVLFFGTRNGNGQPPPMPFDGETWLGLLLGHLPVEVLDYAAWIQRGHLGFYTGLSPFVLNKVREKIGLQPICLVPELIIDFRGEISGIAAGVLLTADHQRVLNFSAPVGEVLRGALLRLKAAGVTVTTSNHLEHIQGK